MRKKLSISICLLTVMAVALYHVTEPAAIAQGQGVAARFPEANRVAADFPDEKERYVVLNLLWDTLHEKAPDAKGKRSTYYQAAEAIRQKYMVLGGAAAAEFDERNRHLTADPAFRRSVLEKYQLINLPVEKPAAAPRTTDVTDAMIKVAFLKASPFALASIVVMVWLAGRGVRKASTRSIVSPPPVNAPAGLPQLPESLRVVSVPLLQYSVDLVSALAFDKETTLHTNVRTTTSGGDVYTIGNQVHSTPIQTSTSVTTTQEDLVWVRTADNRETSWTFTGGAFKVRPGQIISAVTQPARSGSGGFLLAYNHNTGQMLPLGNAHGTSSGGTWWLVTFVGSLGFAIAFGIILSIKPDADADMVARLLSPLVDWIMGVVVSAILASFFVLGAKGKLQAQRNAQFQSRYLPGFQQFLGQCTPALQKHFHTP